MQYTGVLAWKISYGKVLIATKFNMSFNRSTFSNPNNVPKVDAFEPLLRCTDALNESSSHMARAPRDIFTKEEETLNAWKQALGDHNCKDVTNVQEDIVVEDEESEVDSERIYMTEYRTQEFVTCLEVQKMIAAEMRKVTSHWKVSVLTRLVEDTLSEALEVKYDVAKEGMETLLSNLVVEFIDDIIQQGRTDSLQMRNIAASPNAIDLLTH